MATRSVVIGGEGKGKINGVDWEVTDINLTEHETSQDDTCTSDFDTTEKMTYERDKTTARRLTGEFTLQLDRNNRPLGNAALRSGGEYALDLQITNDPTVYGVTGPIKVGEIGIRMGGTKSLWTVTIPFRTQGKYTINGNGS